MRHRKLLLLFYSFWLVQLQLEQPGSWRVEAFTTGICDYVAWSVPKEVGCLGLRVYWQLNSVSSTGTGNRSVL